MNQPDLDRLDSWKAIANHLQRDERTARRWEQSLALPVRRVQGNRGQSVFAYASEIDAWLKKAPLEARPAQKAVVRSVWHARPWQMAAGGATVVVVAALAWRARGLTAIEAPINVQFTPTAIVASGRASTSCTPIERATGNSYGLGTVSVNCFVSHASRSGASIWLAHAPIINPADCPTRRSWKSARRLMMPRARSTPIPRWRRN